MLAVSATGAADARAGPGPEIQMPGHELGLAVEVGEMQHDNLGEPTAGYTDCAGLARLAAVLLSLFFALGAFAVPAYATKYAGEFLKLGVGARALGMGGGPFVALADDASALYWNPAGLAHVERGEMLFMHAEQFGSLANHDFLGFTQPLGTSGRSSAVGAGLIRFGVDGILITRDAFDDLNGNGRWDEGEPIRPDLFRTGSNTEYGLLLSYAREVNDNLAVGGNVKLVRQGLLDNTSFGMGLDLGALLRLDGGFTVGARLADATTTRISWDTGRRESIQPTLILGSAYSRGLDRLGAVTAAVGLSSSFDGRKEASQVSGGAWGSDLQAGLEYWYARSVALRLGMDAGNMTAGAGLRHRGLGADYAFLSHDELDDTHRVSASVRF